ncbi:MAG: HAMP domain-containing sensor histidine kinase [Pseudomonadota bacterium]
MSAGLLHHLHHAIEALGSRPQPGCCEGQPAQVSSGSAPGKLEPTARSIIVDMNGVVMSVGRVCAQNMPALAPGIRLLDLVHVGDRVTWMSALSNLKKGHDAHIHLKLNIAAPQKPQRFKPVCLAYESSFNGQIRIDVSQAQSDEELTANSLPPESEVLALMSHEFRTPLNAILGFSGLLNHSVSDALSDAQKAEYVTLIHDAAEHMLSLVNGILDVSKIGAGKYLIHREVFSFQDIVDEAASMVATKAAEKEIKLNLRTSLEDVGQISADRRAMKQVLINLLSNAIKFTPAHGCVTVDAWWNDDEMNFAVSDTGIGMSDEEQSQLFTAFSQINGDTTMCWRELDCV